MRKVIDYIKPYISIAFGALLLLYYLNWFSFEGAALALGIIGFIVGVIYVGLGVIEAFASKKIEGSAKAVLDMCYMCLFPVFVFIYLLIMMINVKDNMTPTGWVISIYGLIASLAFAGVYSLSKFLRNEMLSKMRYVLASAFGLVLIFGILFNVIGEATLLGAIDIVYFIIYALFAYMMVLGLLKPEAFFEAKPKAEKKEETPQVEEKKEEPQEEAPQE